MLLQGRHMLLAAEMLILGGWQHTVSFHVRCWSYRALVTVETMLQLLVFCEESASGPITGIAMSA